jgi:hypothetical protein
MSVKVLVRACMLVAVVAAVLVRLSPSVTAHATCNAYECCSPHGQFRSDSGCNFLACSSDSTNYYQRDFDCYPGSPAASACYGLNLIGQSSADASHAVTTWGAYCCNGDANECDW